MRVLNQVLHFPGTRGPRIHWFDDSSSLLLVERLPNREGIKARKLAELTRAYPSLTVEDLSGIINDVMEREKDLLLEIANSPASQYRERLIDRFDQALKDSVLKLLHEEALAESRRKIDATRALDSTWMTADDVTQLMNIRSRPKSRSAREFVRRD